MNGTACTHMDETLRIRLLSYLEGIMDPDEREALEAEIAANPEAARELEALKDMLDVLTNETTVFEPIRPAVMPPDTWAKVSAALSVQSLAPPSPLSRISGFLRRLFSAGPRPAFALGVAVAAALIVVALYPARAPQPELALSRVAWDDEFTPKRVAPVAHKERVAFLIQKDNPRVLPQGRIDELYAALKPSDADTGQRNFIAPSQVHTALSGGVASVSEAAARLHAKLAVTTVVVLTLSRSGNAFAVRGQTLDAASGKPVAVPVETEAVEAATLGRQTREAAYGALAMERKGPK